ncbi:hypothetical protein EZS27_003098 [termite gut metagenome]|uniref:Uncharacterized protein n=1 Tax=termite gut metagenome TaxID=433724 RepID=A0A5J4SVJ3_9ZZZZ
MKRLVLTLVVIIGLGASAFAAKNQPANGKWNGNINVSKLSNYLVLSSDQTEEVAQICDYLAEQMSRANSARKSKDLLLHNAIYGNLKLMKNTLTTEQYSKYLRLINVTLNNNGIEVK